MAHVHEQRSCNYNERRCTIGHSALGFLGMDAICSTSHGRSLFPRSEDTKRSGHITSGVRTSTVASRAGRTHNEQHVLRHNCEQASRSLRCQHLHPVPPTPALVLHATACDVSSAHHLLAPCLPRPCCLYSVLYVLLLDSPASAYYVMC